MPLPSRRRLRLASCSKHRRSRLTIEALEDRAVPANNLTIVDASVDDSAFVDVKTTGQTTTISTKVPDAELSIATLQAALADIGPNVRNVVVTTDVANGETDGDQAGDIVWDATLTGDLDFNGFGTRKTLTFQTVAGAGAVGDITLTAVAFLNNGTDDHINLVFDTSDTDGSVTLQDDGAGSGTVVYSAEAIVDFTVTAGSGAFHFTDNSVDIGAADVAGAVSISAGDVFISHQGGLTAGTDLTITADMFALTDGSGLLATNNVSVTAATTATVGDNAGMTAGVHLTVAAPDVTLGAAILTTETLDGDLTVAGSTSVSATLTQFTVGRNLGVSGGDVGLVGISATATGGLAIFGSSSIGIDFADLVISGNTFVTGGAVDISGMNLQNSGDVSIVGTTMVIANTTAIADAGNLELNASSIGTTDVVLGASSGIFVHGDVAATGLLDVRAVGTIFFNDAVDGAEHFFVESNGTVNFFQDVGGLSPINEAIFNGGLVNFGVNDLTATTVAVGSSFSPIEATLASSGIITGDVTVQIEGNLAPGGLGTVGTMTVRGNVDFVTPTVFGPSMGGDLAIDFGPGGTADKLIVLDNALTPATEGNVDLTAGARLGGELGTGQLTGPSAVIVDPSGAVTGQFTNAPLGVGLIVGTDAVNVVAYSPDIVVAPVTALVNGTAVGADPDDGTLFKVTLTGPGQLVLDRDWRNFMFLVVRNSTPLSRLTITTTANGSDNIVTFNAGILINGSIAAVTAPKVNIGSQFRATGFVRTAVIRDLTNLDNARLEFGGAPAILSTISARNLFGSVITGSTLTTLKVAQNLGAQVFVPFLPDSVLSAPAIGTVTAKNATIQLQTDGRLGAMRVAGDFFGGVDAGSIGTVSAASLQGTVKSQGAAALVKTTRRFDGEVNAVSLTRFEAGGGAMTFRATGAVGTIIGRGEGIALDVVADRIGVVRVTGGLSGNGVGWNVTNGVGSLTADVIGDLNLRAKFIGPVLVTGNSVLGYAGDIAFSTFTLTGNDGTAGAFGLKSLTAKGRVDGTLIDVQSGNVGAVTVGRFYFSQLHVNYTPDATLAFNEGGTFGQGTFRLASFKTTAVPTPDPTNFYQWAFRGSEIAAEVIGTVTLTGLSTDNFGGGFGIKEQNPGSVVRVLAADAGFPPNQLNVALTPDDTAPYDPIGGDFFLINV